MTYPSHSQFHRFWLDDRTYAVNLPWNEMEKPKVIPSEIRVQLSRPLTWAEWERLTDIIEFQNLDTLDVAEVSFKRNQGNDFSLIWIEADMNSRDLFKAFADFIAEEFVNVYPKAVYTKQEMA